MLRVIKETKLRRFVRPFLLTIAVSQCCFAAALLALGIVGILVQATYAIIGMGIWAGTTGCLASAWWAFNLSRFSERFGMRLLPLVLISHLAFLILCFVSASFDFNRLLSIMPTCIGAPIKANCSSTANYSSIIVEANTRFTALLVDLNSTAFALVATSLDLILLLLGLKLRGVKNISIFASMKKESEGNKDLAVEVVLPQDERMKSKAVLKVVVRLLSFCFAILTLSVASLVIAIEIVGIVIGIRLAVFPVWIVIAIVIAVITRRMAKKQSVCWFKFLAVFFIICCLINCAVIVLAAIGLKLDWSSILRAIKMSELKSDVDKFAAMERTTPNSNPSPSTNSTDLSQPVPSNWESNEKMVWKVTLAALRVTLVFFLLLLNAAKSTVTIFIIKAWRKKAVSEKIKNAHNSIVEETAN